MDTLDIRYDDFCSPGNEEPGKSSSWICFARKENEEAKWGYWS